MKSASEKDEGESNLEVKTYQQSSKKSAHSRFTIKQRKRENLLVESQDSVDSQDQDISNNDRQKSLQNIGNELQQVVFKVKLKKQVKNMVGLTSKRRLEQLNQGKIHFLNDKSTSQHIQQFAINETQIEMDNSQKGAILANKFRELLYSKKKMQLIHILKKFPVFNPAHKFKLLWDIIINGLTIVAIFFIPISFVYDKPLYTYLNYGFRFIIPIFLTLDLLVSCNTSYFEKGRLQLKRFKIFKNFLKSNFFSDIAPIIVYFSVSLLESYNTISKLFIFLFFTKIAQIWRIFRKFEESTQLGKSISNIIQLFQLLIMILFISHLFASIWLYIGLNTTTMYQKTWIIVKELNLSDWKTQYLNAYYYSIVTMVTVGYGDITPTNNIEMIFTVFSMMICCGVFAYSLNQVENELRKNMSIINNYMESKKVSKHLQYQVRQYLDFYWREEYCNNIESQMKIINQLSGGLKEILLMEANKIALIDCPIFRENFSKALIAKTVPLIKEIRYTPEEKIFCQDDQDDSNIYFIEKGKVEVCSYYAHPIVKKQKMINSLQKLQKGQSFGEFSFFTGQPRKFTVRSLEFSTILTIKRNDFIQLLQEFPDDYEKFCMLKDQISLSQEYRPIGVTCYACNKGTHSVGECPILHYIPRKIKIINDYSRGKVQSRQFYRRKNFKMKFTPYKLDRIQQDIIYNLEDEFEQYVADYLYETEEDDLETSLKISKMGFQPNEQFDKMLKDTTSNCDQFSRFQSIASNLNPNLSENVELVTPNSKFANQKQNEQKMELLKQLQASQDISIMSLHNTTIQQLFPKMPSQNSITDRFLKESVNSEEPNIVQSQLESQNSIVTDHNNKRPSIFKMIYLNTQNTTQNCQNDKEYEEYQNLHLSPNITIEQNNNAEAGVQNQSNNIFSFSQSNNQLGEKLSTNKFTQVTKTSQKCISSNQFGSKNRKTQSKQLNNYTNTNSSNKFANNGRQSVLLLEKALSSIQQRSSLIQKPQSYDYENQVYQFFHKQLKNLKGFYEDMSKEIITDTIKDFKVYFPKYNCSRIVEKLQQQQQVTLQEALNKNLKRIIKATNLKKLKSKENLVKNEDKEIIFRIKSKENQDAFIISNHSKSSFEIDKKQTQEIKQVCQADEDINPTNVTITQYTQPVCNANPINSFIDESQNQDDLRQTNNISLQLKKREKYYTQDDSISFCLPQNESK